MGWTGCELVECVPGRCSGAPTGVGTRVFPETFVEGAADGMSLEKMHDQFPSVSVDQIAGLLAFARGKQSAA
jgi:uncharacterized protein (DUF433 family)